MDDRIRKFLRHDSFRYRKAIVSAVLQECRRQNAPAEILALAHLALNIISGDCSPSKAEDAAHRAHLMGNRAVRQGPGQGTKWMSHMTMAFACEESLRVASFVKDNPLKLTKIIKCCLQRLETLKALSAEQKD